MKLKNFLQHQAVTQYDSIMLQTSMYENQTATPNQHKEYVNYDCRLHNTTALKPWLFMALKEFMCRQAIFIYSLFTVNVVITVRI